MTREEKESRGKNKALEFYRQLENSTEWQNATHFKIKNSSVSAKGRWLSPLTLRLYDYNKEKYKSRPIYSYEWKKSNIEYDAFFEKLKELLENSKLLEV